MAKKTTVAKPKKKKDRHELILTKLRAIAPQKEENGIFDAHLSSAGIESGVKYVLQFGLDPLDDATGAVPFGRITEIYGEDASGKTALAMKLCINAQRMMIHHVDKVTKALTLFKKTEAEVTVLFIDNEQSLDDGEKITVDGEVLNAIVTRCDTIDQMFKMCESAIDTLIKYEEEVGIMQMLVIVVDTIAGTSSQEELKAAWGKKDYARQPQLLRAGFRRMTRKLNKRNVAMICTNQVSETYDEKKKGAAKFAAPRDEGFRAFGGRALRFYARLRIFVQCIKDYKINPKAKFPDGFVGNAYIKKNSQKKPRRECRFVLMYEGGLNNMFSILEHLIYMELIKYDPKNKTYGFRFKHYGIKTTTFEQTSLQDDADAEEAGTSKRASKRKSAVGNPKIKIRAEWPAFYADHRSDIDLMMAKAKEIMFACETMGTFDDEGDENDDLEEAVVYAGESDSDFLDEEDDNK